MKPFRIDPLRTWRYFHVTFAADCGDLPPRNQHGTILDHLSIAHMYRRRGDGKIRCGRNGRQQAAGSEE
jgi:hypothetical protein